MKPDADIFLCAAVSGYATGSTKQTHLALKMQTERSDLVLKSLREGEEKEPDLLPAICKMPVSCC